MEAGVNPGGTFNANPISIAACKATIRELEKPGVYKHMARLTKRLTAGINKISKKRDLTLYCDGIESIWHLAFGIREGMSDFRDNFKVNKMDYQVFRKGCLERGIRLHPSRGRFYVSAAHTDEDIDKTLSVAEEVLGQMSKRQP